LKGGRGFLGERHSVNLFLIAIQSWKEGEKNKMMSVTAQEDGLGRMDVQVESLADLLGLVIWPKLGFWGQAPNLGRLPSPGTRLCYFQLVSCSPRNKVVRL